MDIKTIATCKDVYDYLEHYGRVRIEITFKNNTYIVTSMNAHSHDLYKGIGETLLFALQNQKVTGNAYDKGE